MFVSGSAKVDSNIGAWTSGENFITTTISNTTLSDFIEVVKGEDIMVNLLLFKMLKYWISKPQNVTKDVTIEVKISVLLKGNASITTTEM